MSAMTDTAWLIVAGFIGLLFSVGFPLTDHIEYRRFVKKYGKETADEHFRRM